MLLFSQSFQQQEVPFRCALSLGHCNVAWEWLRFSAPQYCEITQDLSGPQATLKHQVRPGTLRGASMCIESVTPQRQIKVLERGTGSGSWIASVVNVEEKVLLFVIATF